MAINPASMSSQSGVTNVVNTNSVIAAGAATPDTTPTTSTGQAAIYEKSDQTDVNPKTTYTRDAATLSDINKQVETKLASLRATVENLVSMQSVKTGEAQGLSYEQIMEKYDGKLKAFYEKLEVDDSTRLNAQQEIAEDGFWGVKQASQRAIEFAKALAGGDPSKIAVLRQSIEEGYQAAEKAWGGALPEICKQTQEATLKGLDDWANEANKTNQTN